MKTTIQQKSNHTTKDESMTLLLLLSYNKMKLYNENFSANAEAQKKNGTHDKQVSQPYRY